MTLALMLTARIPSPVPCTGPEWSRASSPSGLFLLEGGGGRGSPDTPFPHPSLTRGFSVFFHCQPKIWLARPPRGPQQKPVAILVGDNPASRSYVRSKDNTARDRGRGWPTENAASTQAHDQFFRPKTLIP